MNKLIIAGLLVLPTFAFADLGIMDTASETSAKTSAGVSQIYDHPADAPNGQFVVPVQYNRTVAEGNGTEHDSNDPKPNDIDYIPLNQLKGATGSQGNTGTSGVAGSTGAKGEKGDKGDPGQNAYAPAIDPRVDVEVREYDAKHWSLSSFASFGFQSSTTRYIVGQKLTLKLGKSYEERELEQLRSDIKAANLKLKIK